jgi:hypothetical protein
MANANALSRPVASCLTPLTMVPVSVRGIKNLWPTVAR